MSSLAFVLRLAWRAQASSFGRGGTTGATRIQIPIAYKRTRTIPSKSRFHSSISTPPSSSPENDNTKPDDKLKMEPKLELTFTCKVPNCDHRSSHEFSKASYEKGIVLIQCPNCKNRHLIADHLGWFKDVEETKGGKLKTVEEFMKEKGETVKKGRMGAGKGGVLEYVDE